MDRDAAENVQKSRSRGAPAAPRPDHLSSTSLCVCCAGSSPNPAGRTWGCASSSGRERTQVPLGPWALFVPKTLQQKSGPHPSFPALLGFHVVGSWGGRRRGRDSEGGSLIEAEPAPLCQALLHTWQWGSQNVPLGHGWPLPLGVRNHSQSAASLTSKPRFVSSLGGGRPAAN